MWPDHSSDFSQFELQGEEQVRRKLADHAYSTATAYGNAARWLELKERQRAQQAQAARRQSEEARFLAERQTRATEVSNQLAERQVRLAENSNRIAESANHFSKWALGIGIASFIVSIAVAIFK